MVIVRFIFLSMLIFPLSAPYGWTPPENLDEPVNSPGYDGHPCISSDGTELYLTLDRAGGFGLHDLWVSAREGDDWGSPTNLGDVINTSDYDISCALSADGSQLYFASTRPGGYGDFDLYVAGRSDDGWEAPTNIDPPVNTEFKEVTPFITADGKWLFFTSNRPGGSGGDDLWVSENAGGTWQEPVNLGSTVNSGTDDRYPSLPASMERLFFASMRAGGYGQYDIYESAGSGSTWGEPTNLGEPVNTVYGEVHCYPTPDATTLYFASDRLGGVGYLDIYLTEEDADVSPTSLGYIKGTFR
jgi:Tol biopolymer transport system component